jgi:uncharacterized protein YndB with AHSA1/START domain
MSERSVQHGTFVVERRYEASPERTFAAWADREAKARWFIDTDAYLELDFRISVSVATAEFLPERDGSRLVFTEQGAFLDGHEMPAQREQGMGSLLDRLGQWLQSSRSGG